MRIVATVFALLLTTGCGDDDDTSADGDADADADADADSDADADGDADADADADADVTTVWSFAGLGAESRVEHTLHADGSESMSCRTLQEPRNLGPFVQRALHEVELDATGRLVSSDLSIWLTMGTQEIRKRFVVDAVAGEARITRPAGAYRVPFATDLPVVPYPSTSQFELNEPSLSPCGAWTTIRARATGSDLRVFVVDYGTDVVIPNDGELPRVGDVVPEGEITFDDRFVLTMASPNTGVWERYDEDFGPLFDDFTVDEAADPLPPADCSVGGTAESFVVASTDGGEVHGVVSLPEGAGPFPFVVLSEGTPGGPRDLPPITCLSRELVAAGYAVVSFDDRGYGESPGDLMVDLTFAHREDDLIAVTEWAAARDDLDADRLFVYGHSEGTVHAMAAAAAVPEVDAMILLAGSGRRFADEIPMQSVRLLTNLGYPQDIIDGSRASAESVVAQVLDGTYEGELPVSIEYMRQMYEADGAAYATAAAKPALILQGDLDYLVGSDNAELLGGALTAAGVADVTVTHYARMGHWLEPVPEGIASYGEEIHRPYPWYGAVVGDIIAWLDAR